MKTTHTQRKSNAPTRRKLMANARRDTRTLATISTLADAATAEAEATYTTRPQHAAAVAAVALREIAAQLPTPTIIKEVSCRRPRR